MEMAAMPAIHGIEAARMQQHSSCCLLERGAVITATSSSTQATFGRRRRSFRDFSSSSSSSSPRKLVYCCWVLNSKPSSSSSSSFSPCSSTAASSPCCVLPQNKTQQQRSKRSLGRFGAARASTSATAVAPPVVAVAAVSDQVRPSPAEAAKTIVDICTEGTLSTLSEDEWPTATAVRFALDAEGNPVFRFSASALHTRNLAADNRSSLHVQLEQPGRRRPQCTLRGRIQRIEDPAHILKLDIAWERRFGQERVQEDDYYVMNVEQALHAQDMGEEEVWVSGNDFSAAVADPLRDCATRIVEDMNRKHWEDVRRFCNSHARLDVEVEEVSMTWVDRLGFDLRVLTRSPQTLLEVRIPFSRVVSDERDARSSLTMMAQVAWEYERNYSPPDVQLLGSFNVSS